ncbi:sensor histidine kinase [Noviherbaspirillum saxi]|uniref:Sensor histidine kinase n=2 Tax=Noviherbaspirillum saxi TaxID=2320863 RepID=A0A3A3GD00_9BURK|nr:sensor histidine kinase [Noviherbaspirillum saxi]
MSTYPRLRRFVIDVAITWVFNTVIALLITFVMRIHSSFYINFVISMCIGTLMVTIIDGGRLLLWGLEKPPRIPFLVLFAASLPASQYLGNGIASWLLDIPRENFEAVRANNVVGFLVLFVIVCGGITWFFWNRSLVEHFKAEAAGEKARAAAIEKQALQAQLQMLQAQIEPHMLFNTLANLQGLIAVDAARAQHMLDQLIQYLRATLASSRSEQTSLAHEFSLMDAYLGLMQVRMGSRLSYHLQLPDEMHGLNIPPMLLQPLVENAIKHGVEPKVGGGRIEVEALREQNMLVLRVRDTGLGLGATPADQRSTRLGVANTRERLRALYGEAATFFLGPNVPCGAIAELRIPL